MPISAIRILLIDDHKLIRAGLSLLIETHPGLKVVGEAGNRAESLALAVAERPDVILLDVDLGDENGLDLLPDLLSIVPRAKIIILTGLRDQQIHLRAAQLGALGVVTKDHVKEMVVSAIEKVNAGEAWFDGAIVAKALTSFYVSPKKEPANPDASKFERLTKREHEIIQLVNQGLKNQQIADRLFISEGTVRNHLTTIYGKLEVADRFGLITLANRYSNKGNKF